MYYNISIYQKKTFEADKKRQANLYNQLSIELFKFESW